VANHWYIIIDGSQTGPLTWNQITQLAQRGQVKPGDLIWNNTLTSWVNAESIPGLLISPEPYTPISTQINKSDRQAAVAELEDFRKKRKSWAWLFFFLILPIIFGLIWYDTGELSTDVWLGFAGFIVVTALLAYYSSRKTNQGWIGTVTDKDRWEVKVRIPAKGLFYYETQVKHALNIETDSGTKIALAVSPAYYEYFSVGDRIIKIKGFDYPEKVNRDGIEQVCITCGAFFDIGLDNCSRCKSPAINPENFI